MKYKNKNFKLSVADSIILLFLAVSFVLGGFFLNLYSDTQSKYNIEKTCVDFIIPSPSAEQINTLSNLEHIDSAIPYGYVSKSLSHGSKTLKTNIFILDDLNAVSYTVFSDELLTSKSKELMDNAIFVSSKVADALKLRVDDVVTASVFEDAIEFTVAAIYEDDQRNVGGSVIVALSGDLEKDKPESYIYSGAYIASNNYETTKEYLNSYKPLGDLRPREDFDSDDLYEIYLNSRENTDYTKSIFYRDAFLAEVSNRNDAKLSRNLTLTIVVDVVGLLMLFAWVLIRAIKYCKDEVRSDIRNNYTAKQEQKMFNTYFVLTIAVSIVASCVLSFATNILWNINLFSAFNVVTAIVSVVLILGAWLVQTQMLKNMFAKKQ